MSKKTYKLWSLEKPDGTLDLNFLNVDEPSEILGVGYSHVQVEINKIGSHPDTVRLEELSRLMFIYSSRALQLIKFMFPYGNLDRQAVDGKIEEMIEICGEKK